MNNTTNRHQIPHRRNQGCQIYHPYRVWLVPNGTNLGLKLILKSPRLVPFWANLTQFGWQINLTSLVGVCRKQHHFVQIHALKTWLVRHTTDSLYTSTYITTYDVLSVRSLNINSRFEIVVVGAWRQSNVITEPHRDRGRWRHVIWYTVYFNDESYDVITGMFTQMRVNVWSLIPNHLKIFW